MFISCNSACAISEKQTDYKVLLSHHFSKDFHNVMWKAVIDIFICEIFNMVTSQVSALIIHSHHNNHYCIARLTTMKLTKNKYRNALFFHDFVV